MSNNIERHRPAFGWSRWWSRAALTLLISVSACGHGIFPSSSSSSSGANNGGSGTARSVYVTNFADGNVSALANSGGILSSPTTVTGGTANGPRGLVLTPPAATLPTALYAANSADNLIHEFAVDSSGNLSMLATIAAGSLPLQIAVDSTGSFAYAINAGGSISEYTISSTDGLLTANSPSSITTGLTAPVGGVVNGSFLYVTDPSGGTGLVLIFTLTNGLLSFTGSVATGGNNPGPVTSLSVSGGSTWVFTADATSGEVSVFQVQGSALALFGTISTGAAATDLAVGTNPAGTTFLYVANPGANSVASFSFNTVTGVLAAFAVTSGFNGPIGLALDNPGFASTLFVTNNGNGTVATLAIDSTTGQLTSINSFVTESPANASSGPAYVTVIP